MNQTYTLTKLRNDIYKLADVVLQTGQAIRIKRGDDILLLTPEKKKKKLDNLITHKNVVNGNKNDLIKFSPWNEKQWIKKQQKHT